MCIISPSKSQNHCVTDVACFICLYGVFLERCGQREISLGLRTLAPRRSLWLYGKSLCPTYLVSIIHALSTKYNPITGELRYLELVGTE